MRTLPDVRTLSILFLALAHGCSPASEPKPPTGPYLLWQAPGGYAANGSAVEVYADGRVRLWRSTSPQEPGQTAAPSATLQLEPRAIVDLVDRLGAIDFEQMESLISGRTLVFRECYPRLYFRRCAECALQDLSYQAASQLQPEFNEVYAWFATHLGSAATTLPDKYCEWEL